MMITTTNELFLSDYFLFEVSLDGLCKSEDLFDLICSIYGLQDEVEEKQNLCELLRTEALDEIRSEADFKRYCRIKQYNKLTGAKALYSQKVDSLISLKGDALTKSVRNGLFFARKRSESMVLEKLMMLAQGGNRLSLKLLGVLQCEGLGIPQDLSKGLKNLTCAARWGDYTAAIALFRYADDNGRLEAMRLLKGAVENTPYDFLPAKLGARYGVSSDGECSAEVQLLRKVFNLGTINPETYQPGYARLLFSPTLHFREKERILFSGDQRLIHEACELPLRLASESPEIDAEAFAQLSMNRPEEIERIVRGLGDLSLLKEGQIPPMCLSSKSDYVLEQYASAICKALKNTNVTRIDLKDLLVQDLAPTKDHVFLRDLRDDTVNVYLLVFQGNVEYEAFSAAKALLSGKKRSRFHLKEPMLDLDLSAALPICLCDPENARRLKSCVEFVDLSPLTAEEKPAAIRAIASETGKRYGVGSVSLEDPLLDRLCEISAETTAKAIELFIRENRRKGNRLVLNSEVTEPYIRKITAGETTIGFGGNNYGNE